ncbi:MAG: aminotransferase class I/II-fold pyridoxal phosphate-dependent enzyme [Microbacteriaceae bacterium]|nr:aminotransferase class I/II-fold pyridoxal phosphate-dependent enzyme [Microbacteriaceae bacterium]
MNSIVLAIAERSPRGIAGGISRLITSGDLAPGDRLPTVRDLAAELGVSPATVSHAWQTLAAAGLIVSRGRSGSFVRSAPRDWMPHRYRGLDGHHEARLDLSRGTPDPGLLPALGPALSRISTRADTSSYQQKPDIPELHDLLRDTWPSPVESITVTNGALDAIDRALASLVRYGDRIIVENPTFPPFLDLLDHHGLEPVGVGVDAEGMIPSEFSAALRARPAVVLLQPRAHNPTGASVSVERAKQLAFELYRSRFAADAIVIEDDHSGAISTAPEVTLATWLPERVLHVRSFSKTHGPDLRIGALGGPRALVDRVVARRLLGPGWTSRMTQALLFELLTDPVSLREVEHAREVYARRQEGFARALRACGMDAVAGDGLNTWLRVAGERDAIVRLTSAGIRVAPGGPFVLGDAANPDGQGAGHVRVTVGVAGDDPGPVAATIADALGGPVRVLALG